MPRVIRCDGPIKRNTEKIVTQLRTELGRTRIPDRQKNLIIQSISSSPPPAPTLSYAPTPSIVKPALSPMTTRKNLADKARKRFQAPVDEEFEAAFQRYYQRKGNTGSGLKKSTRRRKARKSRKVRKVRKSIKGKVIRKHKTRGHKHKRNHKRTQRRRR